MSKIKEFFGREKCLILGGLVVLAITTALRLTSLTILPVFADEAIYIRWAEVMKAEPSLRFLPLSDGKQPLFMWTVIPFLKLFSDPLVSGRMVSVLSGISSLVGIFLLSHILFKSYRVSLISSLFYAVSPFTLFFDRMALADSMLSMFGVWTLLLGVLTAKKLRLDLAMLTGFALGGALLTKSPAIFFATLLPLTWLLSPWPKGKNEKIAHLVKLVFLLLATFLLSLLLYNILRLGPNFNMIGARNQDYIFPISHLWTDPRDPFVFLIDRSFEWIRMMGPWPIIILGSIGLSVNLRKNWREIIILASWFIIPILVQSEFAKVFTARYILFSIPYLFILAGSAFLPARKVFQWVLMIFLGFFLLLAFVFDYSLFTNPERANLPRSERSGYLEEWTAGQGIKEIADNLRAKEEKNQGIKIVVGTEGYFGTLPDGLQMYLNDRPEITVIGTGLNFITLPTSLVESKRAGNATYLVVNKSRFNGNAARLGLKLIASYPKAVRPEGLHEYVVYGPQDELLFFEVINP